MSRTVSFFIVIVCVIAVGLASPATQLPCPDVATQCEVSNVDITPCAKKDRCSLKIGKSATISFDFTPQFAAKELETLVTTVFGGQVVSMPGFDKEACKFTTCPVTQGQKQSFSYNLPLQRSKVTRGSFDIKWTLWNKEDPTQICCFNTRIKLMN